MGVNPKRNGITRTRAGDWVEVRSAEEILATLDEQGSLDGLPFMPEMLKFCGKRLQVAQVAHKTCDTVHYSGIRRMDAAVHLENAHCDGAAHGGCQASCLTFWKHAWLKPVSSSTTPRAEPARPRTQKVPELLECATRQPGSMAHDVRYRCQITELLAATRGWAWWNPAQYWADVTTGNWTAGHVFKVLTLAAVRRLIAFNRGVRLLGALYDALARRFSMLPYALIRDQAGPIPKDAPTPTGGPALAPGDWVRVRPREEILETLNKTARNRGLHFDPEMVRYCGGTHRVKDIVTHILDEATGRMVTMKNPCVMLEGVVCKSEYSGKRLMCPRAITPYWRPLWLEKVAGPRRVNNGAANERAGR